MFFKHDMLMAQKISCSIVAILSVKAHQMCSTSAPADSKPAASSFEVKVPKRSFKSNGIKENSGTDKQNHVTFACK